MDAQYQITYDSEIFQKSQCITKENHLYDFVTDNLLALGYTALDDSRKKWMRDNKKVVVCLVDDISSCADYQDRSVGMMFDRNTVVITDNHINVPTQYRVCRLPHSFYGIYAYEPTAYHWRPERRFAMPIRRIDTDRLRIFLETIKSVQQFPIPESADWISFDCWDRAGKNDTDQDRRDNFAAATEQLAEDEHNNYSGLLHHYQQQMPFRNYSEPLEQIVYKAWLHVVVETYNGDDIIALSEKTFRALVTPTPFMLYAGRGALCHLSNIGFDIVDDMVRPLYDMYKRTGTGTEGDKHVEFVWEAALISNDMTACTPEKMYEIQERCRAAGQHNQDLLRDLASRWPKDFARWWSNTVEIIA